MQFRKAISEIKGLQYLAEELDLKSPMGKRFLMDTDMFCSEAELNIEYGLLDQITQAVKADQKVISDIQSKLSHLREIRGSVDNLKSNLVLDDVELFEIKSFAMNCHAVLNLQKELKQVVIELPNLSGLIEILDPQNTGIPSFYIYDDYSLELAEARKELRIAKSTNGDSEIKLEDLFCKAQEIESKVREEICTKIRSFASDLEIAIRKLAHLDLLIAKAMQAIQLNFNRPELVKESTSYIGMFHPMVKHELEKQNKQYQAIDIELQKSVCLITGANMAGKTVVLKTLALCQYLCQFGFHVPATSAQISLVDQVLLSVGDEQSELSGLSSFASEMMNVSKMVEESKKHSNVLILVDELARTTNPVEGLAIVNAVADIFYQNNIRSVITTHYSGLNSYFRKLRVKGLDKDLGDKIITQKNINSYMDYSLVEDNTGEVPHEALRIASLLGISKEIVEGAQNQLNKKASKEEIL
ncbi:DNA mismatch repair protein MutS [Marinifilum breve]|uniref:DNA mismatch repair protein MutS n=1 Tax=Marinifilum breve TaxID=2184082 RepID=A0A2V3ZT38_9BACT|nr:DNA mismatch repair protein MutS [Marinifilum breve]PXX96847.1 DNA mismatch repair protein MutS [Marinifilum breve]